MENNQYRLKTKFELIEEFGYYFDSIFESIEQSTILCKYLGELINHPDLINLGITIPDKLMSSKELIPLGSKVSFPTSKSYGDTLEESWIYKNYKNSQNFLYYNGPTNEEGFYLLNHEFNEKYLTGDFYTANEILEFYETYNLKIKTPLLELFMYYLNKK